MWRSIPLGLCFTMAIACHAADLVPTTPVSQLLWYDSPARLAKNALTKLKIARKMPIAVPPCLVTRPESYCKGVLRAMIVSASESTRTEFSGGTGFGQSPGSPAEAQQESPVSGVLDGDGHCWARTSDLLLVREAL